MLRFTAPDRVPLWPYAPFAILTLLHLYAQATGAEPLASWTKTWLMLALLLAFLLTVPRGTWLPTALGATALLGSSLGDNSDLGGEEFLRGLGAFAVAHLAYIVLFWWGLGLRLGKARKWALLYLPLVLAILSVVLPHAGAMAPAVAIYASLIVTMAALGSAGNGATAWGAALFVASDSVLSLDLFVPGFDFWQIDLVIMATYTIGQGLIIYGVVRRLHGLPATPAPGTPAGDGGARGTAPHPVR